MRLNLILPVVLLSKRKPEVWFLLQKIFPHPLIPPQPEEGGGNFQWLLPNAAAVSTDLSASTSQMLQRGNDVKLGSKSQHLRVQLSPPSHDCTPSLHPHSKQSVSPVFNAHFYHKNCPHQHSQLRYYCRVFPVWMQRGCRMLAARDESEELELGWREWGGRAGGRTFKRTSEKWIKQNERKTKELGLSHEAQSSFFILLRFGLKCWYNFRGWGWAYVFSLCYSSSQDCKQKHHLL